MLQTLDSSLLYTRADGTQGFVHDTVETFFLAVSLVEKLAEGSLSVLSATDISLDQLPSIGQFTIEDAHLFTSLMELADDALLGNDNPQLQSYRRFFGKKYAFYFSKGIISTSGYGKEEGIMREYVWLGLFEGSKDMYFFCKEGPRYILFPEDASNHHMGYTWRTLRNIISEDGEEVDLDDLRRCIDTKRDTTYRNPLEALLRSANDKHT